MIRGPYKKPPSELRFWPKVEKTLHGCWVWTACKNSRGYGRFTDPQLAHEAYCKAAREYSGEFANEGFAAGVALGYVGGRR